MGVGLGLRLGHGRVIEVSCPEAESSLRGGRSILICSGRVLDVPGMLVPQGHWTVVSSARAGLTPVLNCPLRAQNLAQRLLSKRLLGLSDEKTEDTWGCHGAVDKPGPLSVRHSFRCVGLSGAQHTAFLRPYWVTFLP